MAIDINSIHIFKTNISNDLDLLKVKSIFDSKLDITSWSVDLEDVDCVLRVVSVIITKEEIINHINQLGFDCRELE